MGKAAGIEGMGTFPGRVGRLAVQTAFALLPAPVAERLCSVSSIAAAAQPAVAALVVLAFPWEVGKRRGSSRTEQRNAGGRWAASWDSAFLAGVAAVDGGEDEGGMPVPVPLVDPVLLQRP